jgi:hypothetical protein
VPIVLHPQWTPQRLELVHEKLHCQILSGFLLEAEEWGRHLIACVREGTHGAPAAALHGRPCRAEALLERLRVVQKLDAVVALRAAVTALAQQTRRVEIEVLVALLRAVLIGAWESTAIPQVVIIRAQLSIVRGGLVDARQSLERCDVKWLCRLQLHPGIGLVE